MKYSIPTFLTILTLFLITQFVGLTANEIYLSSKLPYGLEPPKVEQNTSPLFFISMIVVVSVVFIVMQKLRFRILMKAWFFIAITTCIAVTLSAFIKPWIAIILSLVIVVMKMKERDIYIHNLGEILVYGGVVALFAPILNFWTALILLILMSIYDYIAVFITKHMINLAKMQGELGIFSGLMVRNKDEIAILGGGDIAFTLLFAVVVLKQFGMISALLSIYGSALFITILMIIGKKKKYYPAMPFVTAGSLLGFIISLI